ncbi:hypothetical protein MR772_07850, partial [bacterium]|nr:hypothetical protein [bacterium]
TGYLLFDAAFRPSFVARLRLSPRLGRIFFNKQASNQLDAQLVIAICVMIPAHRNEVDVSCPTESTMNW